MLPPDMPLLDSALRKVLIVDPIDPDSGPRFPCRPLTARGQEGHTMFGVFTGQIGLSGVPEFTAALRDLASSEHRSKIILDFSRLSLTRSATGALVDFAAAMHGRNKRLYLYKTSSQIRGVLKELKLSSFFSFLETEDDIIAALVA